MAARKRQTEPKGPKAQMVQLSPPAYSIRRQAGLALPNGRQMLEAVSGVLGGALLGAVLIRRGHLHATPALLQRISRMLAATAVMTVALWGAQRVLFAAAPTHGMVRLAALAALVATGLVVYAAAALLFGAADREQIGRLISRRLARPR